jgi:4,5-dihydroxyphthalate decarboxylase
MIDREIRTIPTYLMNDPKTAALREGRVSSPRLRFALDDARDGYRQLAQGLHFDCGDLPIGAFLQAKSYGKPLVLMPVVITGRFHHDAIFYNPAQGPLDPGQLDGRRIGVNAYTHTSGIWLRGVLESEYGLDHRRMRWVTLSF